MPYSFEHSVVNENIRLLSLFPIEKMEDLYLQVRFKYPNVVWNGAIPIVSKYQGVNIPLTKDDVFDWSTICYAALDPSRFSIWQHEQENFWRTKNSEDTHLVFDALNGSAPTTKWLCRKCGPVPQVNPQPGARIRSLKQYGYHIATLKLMCQTCGSKQYFDLLIRLPRHAADNQKRCTISKSLRNKILNTLPHEDCLSGVPLDSKACIIDHKFPSSRWVNGETINSLSMTELEIRQKFQILSNQSNLQKERYCQRCVLDGIRGSFLGIEWYYEGDRLWRGSSKADERGCIGCPWYDITKWKSEFNRFLNAKSSKF